MVSLFSLANEGSSEPDYEVGVEQVYVLNGMNQCLWTLCHRLATVTAMPKGSRSRCVLMVSRIKTVHPRLVQGHFHTGLKVVCRRLLHHVHGQCLEVDAQKV
jgi:hypothetical protein